MTPIAEWLRTTRERQLRPDGEPWSQDDFLRELEAATGWHLHRPNYSRYETAKATPKRETLARLVAFWAARGEPGPDLSPKPDPEPAPDLATALLALAGELAALREERQQLVERVTDLEATVAALAAPSVAGTGGGAAPRAPMQTAR